MNKLENEFLNKLKGKSITIYLSSGIKLSGELLNFEEDCLLLDGRNDKIEGHPQLIYKTAISTILPVGSLK